MPVSYDSVYVRATPFVTRGGALALVGRDAPRRRRKSRPRPPASRPSPPTTRPSPAPARGSLRGRPLRVRAPSACANQHSLSVRRGLGKRARRHDSEGCPCIDSSHLQERSQVHMLPSSTNFGAADGCRYPRPCARGSHARPGDKGASGWCTRSGCWSSRPSRAPWGRRSKLSSTAANRIPSLKLMRPAPRAAASPQRRTRRTSCRRTGTRWASPSRPTTDSESPSVGAKVRRRSPQRDHVHRGGDARRREAASSRPSMSGCALGPLGHVTSTPGGRLGARTGRRRALGVQPRASNTPRSACPVAACQTVRSRGRGIDTKQALPFLTTTPAQ